MKTKILTFLMLLLFSITTMGEMSNYERYIAQKEAVEAQQTTNTVQQIPDTVYLHDTVYVKSESTPITVNVYDDDPYYYSNRIGMYYHSGFNYWMYNDPYYWYMSPYYGYGWGWGYSSFYFGWGYPYYGYGYPYYGYGYPYYGGGYYPSYGYANHGSGMLGHHNYGYSSPTYSNGYTGNKNYGIYSASRRSGGSSYTTDTHRSRPSTMSGNSFASKSRTTNQTATQSRRPSNFAFSKNSYSNRSTANTRTSTSSTNKPTYSQSSRSYSPSYSTPNARTRPQYNNSRSTTTQ
jgi:hypothetical protein